MLVVIGFFHLPVALTRAITRSAVAFCSADCGKIAERKATAEQVIARINATGKWKKPITTSIEPAAKWYSAEKYHQDYLKKNPGGYTCHWMRD